MFHNVWFFTIETYQKLFSDHILDKNIKYVKESASTPLVKENAKNSVDHGKRLSFSCFVLKELIKSVLAFPLSIFLSIFLIILKIN